MARLFVAGSVLAAVLSACEPLGPTTEFLENWSRWEGRGPDSYSYEYRRICYCTTEAVEQVRITVTAGQVTAVVRVADGQPVPPEQVNLFFRVTIDSLFALLDDAIEGNAYAIDVSYDPLLGYPTNAFIDYAANIADEELGFTASLQAP